MITSENSLLNKFLQAFGFWGPTYEGIPKALIYVKNIVNLLLWLVSFVALVIILYSFYLMFFTEDSKWIEQVKKNLKGVAIALVILGFSRIIVSFIFDFYQKRLLNPQTEITFVSSSSLTSIT
jgi:vancomycin permeability regulator SanA